MHINFHFAIGVIFTSILHFVYSFTLLEFILIVIFSFLCDFDIFFNKFAKDHNHRLLITHSIIPSVIIIIMGYILRLPILVLCGLSYSIHIFIDTFDWGTNFFYFMKKQIGFKFLISKEELENLSKYLANYKIPSSFFDEKYFSNKVCLGLETFVFVLMVVCLILFALNYLFLIPIYFLWLYFHLQRHFTLKKIEKKYKKIDF
jgi:hypothetical protein